MTIDEAIAHARDVAEKKRDICKLKTRENAPSIFKCAEEYKQLADWLEELRAYKESLALKKEFYEGVKQGRTDKYKEITSEYMLLTEKQVADIRADAIDDFCHWYFDMKNDAQINAVDELIKRFNTEQLKENK